MPPHHDIDDIVSIAVLQLEVGELRKDVEALTASTKELVEAWKAANKLVVFVRWLAGLSTAIGVLWIVARHLWFDKR